MTPAEEREIIERHDFLSWVRQGSMPDVAALAVGWSRPQFKRLLRDPAFAEALEGAQTERDGNIEQKVYDRALDGHWDAQKFWLTNQKADRWADRKQVQVGGEVAIPIHVTVSVREGLKELLTSDPLAARQLGPGGVIDVEEIILDED